MKINFFGLYLTQADAYHASVKGIFPCGEGAGYAGGITSAAADGVRTAEKINDFLAEMM